ncbi:MAG: hypothetical protein RJB66_1324 [Pseudomonadota bacterium]|jgi:hypothetical protein
MNKKYFEIIKTRFPHLADNAEELISDKLLSPYVVRLSKKHLEEAKEVVANLYRLREKPTYSDRVYRGSPEISRWDPSNKSICMSYDFHIDSKQNLKLIEVNTNAAFLLMGYFLYDLHQLPRPIPEFTLETFKASCERESQLSGQTLSSVAIVDENPSSQRLFIEFLLYEQLFKSFGYATNILDPGDLEVKNGSLCFKQEPIDFVYNRTTDFFFEQPNMLALREAYLKKAITLSPNPHEYALLADKHRLIEWSLNLKESAPFPELQKIAGHLLEADYVVDTNSEALWTKKKKVFFKPLTSFGSKGTYRGEGISRPYFDQLINKDYIAQEYCPPQEQLFEAIGFPATQLKYDLRFYAYQGEIQMVVARLYQGQVTNLKTTYGGFAPVVFD